MLAEPIAYAGLDWGEDGLPRSRAYGDVYFSNEGGLAEAQHVFLEGNNLANRLANAGRFLVGELGFGSGLNFLALWQLWEQVAPDGVTLHFISVEKHPLRAQDMSRIHAHFPEIAKHAEALRVALPLPVPGFHRLTLAGGRIQLTLLYGDAVDMLHEQEMAVDAWFLDGFAPRLNAGMWSAELAKQLRRLSAPGATLATFSTSTNVMDALADAGFALEKKPGFGRKKHMLTGSLPGAQRAQPSSPQAVTVIGAGLAGAATARAFAERDCEVTVLEAGEVASGASHNPSAIFYPAVTTDWIAQTQLYYSGFAHSLQQLRHYPDVKQRRCGMLLLPNPTHPPDRQQRAMEGMQPEAEIFHSVTRTEASDIAGVGMPSGGLYFPQGGWVDLHSLTETLLNHPAITVRENTPVTALPQDADLTVLCNGLGAMQLLPELQGIIKPVRGQISCIPPHGEIENLKTVLSYGGYVTPAIEGVHHIGATFARGDEDTALRNENDAYNVEKLNTYLDWNITPQIKQSWAAVRVVSKDRFPLVGMYKEGLAMSLGHGSRGLLTCLLAAEHIASQAFNEPASLPKSLAAKIDPKRF